ncbi:MAG: isoprenyl transferase [Candidatus Omnitrophica bacterium]|nr:isoprenyl transferase [Candidatus Omnitrophota bacterium]MDD5652785.1 isoprenyl transferase [Candidatus Omnitrophota bacterium]
MLDKNNIPRHIAIIMDGNGRWAKQKGLPRTAGHREGVKRVKEIVRRAAQLGVEVVTFFAFSSENWARPKSEVSILMRYLNNFLDSEIRELEENNIRFLTIGRKNPVPEYLQEKLEDAARRTAKNTGLIVVLAFNYGARQEIVDAAKKFSERVELGQAKAAELNEEIFGSYLYTAGLPDPDLLIRTSAQMRISNFLLWQLSYAEFYFPKKYWPEFGPKDLEKAIEVYQKRERRFGGI